jgi:transcription elongation factor Elf1
VQQRWDRNNVRTWRSTNISTIATSRTHCPKCQAQAVVQSAAELRPGIDYLTLRCTSCGLVYNAQVLSDPTKGTAMHTVMNVFEGPIVRIRETCDLMGVGPDFDDPRSPELRRETGHLEKNKPTPLIRRPELKSEIAANTGLNFRQPGAENIRRRPSWRRKVDSNP